MWLFNRLPEAALKARYGFEADKAWREHLMRSAVRFNSGGSGSFVSSDGLVMTNHHVAADMLQKISTPEIDFYKQGFLAKKLEEEKRALDLELNQLIEIQDVTEKVNQAVSSATGSEAAAKARRAAIASIEKESFDATGMRSDVVTLYEGGMYHLYRYKKFTDVRLVFCPEFSIAFFGGDPDNFTYPRYDLDFCLFRVYENGKPAAIQDFLKWSEKGAADNELVFVAGHPGRTNRLFTAEAIRTLRDVRLPFMVDLLKQKEANLVAFGNQSPEHARRAKEDLFGVQNARKVYLGRRDALASKKFMQDKEADEAKLKKAVRSKDAWKPMAGAWEEIERGESVYRKVFLARAFLEQHTAIDSKLFEVARTLVRMADEDAKPNGERLEEYRESSRSSLEQALFSEAPIYVDLEIATLTQSLKFLMEKQGAKHAITQKILKGKTPEVRAKELVEGSKLADVSVRRQLAKGRRSAILSSEDTMIQLAREIDPEARQVRKEFEEKVEEPQRQAYAKITRLRFELYGDKEYPDATFTLRLAFGQVKGYREKGKQVAPWTTIQGAFDHEKKHGAKDPYKLPESWTQAKAALQKKTPFNFVSTNDIIGGNSGSPVVNRKGEVVGLIFDGNIQSLASAYYYSDTQARAVSVHSEAIRHALEKIYGAPELAAKLGK